MDGTRGTTVLVVENDRDRAEEIWSSLEGAGYEVLACPGPCAPDFTCVGGWGKRCALAMGADVVVLDMNLASDVEMEGTPGWELLVYYMGLGKKVVALTGAGDAVHPFPDDQVAVVRRPADGTVLLAALRSLEAKSGAGRGSGVVSRPGRRGSSLPRCGRGAW